MYCPKEKAALFADVFNSKQSTVLTILTIPQLCFPEAAMTTFAFHSGGFNFIFMVMLDLMTFFIVLLELLII